MIYVSDIHIHISTDYKFVLAVNSDHCVHVVLGVITVCMLCLE